MTSAAATSADFVVAAGDRAADGALRQSDLDRIGDVLLRGGFVLLPSDTSYAVAVLPLSEVTRRRLNHLLARPDHPLSLAFPDLAATSRWAAPNRVASGLLSRFCPGPITVVTRAALGVPVQVVDHALGGRNSTVGFRIPESAVERSVASALRYAITTTAVYDETPRQVKEFAAARRIVESRFAATGFPCWCAVEGTVEADGGSSTVVSVTAEGRLDLGRAGPIPFDQIVAERGRILQEQP